MKIWLGAFAGFWMFWAFTIVSSPKCKPEDIGDKMLIYGATLLATLSATVVWSICA